MSKRKRKQKSGKDKPRLARSKHPPHFRNPQGNEPHPPPPDIEEIHPEELRLVAQWRSSRHGAQAGRGFHFQDAVGAWFGAQVAARKITTNALTPEGTEDLTLEDAPVRQVQVKSRAGHLGPFTPKMASRHVVDVWKRSRDRGDTTDTELVVVLEGGLDGHGDLNNLDHRLNDILRPGNAFLEALYARGLDQGFSAEDTNRFLATTTVIGITWPDLTQQTENALRTIADLPPSALQYVTRELRIVVAEAADANANPDHGRRISLNRTELTNRILKLGGQMDLKSLQAALTDGVCEPLQWEAASADDHFYEGVSTQPMHVAAGLVVRRLDVLANVSAGLERYGTVILTGPSGVGKSAVLWTVPEMAPSTLWFRVKHLANEDVEPIVRLARSHRVAANAPVGFLVDSAGTGDFRGWDRLRSEAAAVPGMLLVATARNEDLIELGNLSDCEMVTVILDEFAAEMIFNGLQRSGATSVVHWREAYEDSNGLTMEFTHLLTRGRRLADVVSDQIEIRLKEGRLDELRILDLVSVADRWSATIEIKDLELKLGISPFALRSIVSRLVGEHLVAERDGSMSGLHRLRSAAISDAIHRHPPPELARTVEDVLGVLPTSQIHRFVAELLRDEPELSHLVLKAAAGEELGIHRSVGFLHGLRLNDFVEHAKTWKSIAEKHSVPVSSQSLLFSFAVADLDFPYLFPDELRNARAAITEIPSPKLRDALVDRIGPDRIMTLIAGEKNILTTATFMAVLDGYGQGLSGAASRQLTDGSPFIESLRNADVEAQGEVIAAFRLCDLGLADLLVERLGGESKMLERIRTDNPWITALGVETNNESQVGVARFLYVDPNIQGDSQEMAIAIGRQLLRCFPRISSVDVQAHSAGGHKLEAMGDQYGISRLQRQNCHSNLCLAWNQARIRTSVTLIGATDTVRLSQGLPLLEETTLLTRDIANAFVLSNIRTDIRPLESRRSRLHNSAMAIPPKLGGATIGDTAIGEQVSISTSDPLSEIITVLTSNVFQRLSSDANLILLAAYLENTVIGRDLKGVKQEPWRFIGIEDHPACLDELENTLRDLTSVVSEMAQNDAGKAKIIRNARAGTNRQALARAAKTAKQLRTSRLRVRKNEIEGSFRDLVPGATLLKPRSEGVAGVITEYAITVEVESLFKWYEIASVLSNALDTVRKVGERFTLVPARDGKTVPSMTMRLVSQLQFAGDSGDWATALPEPHSDSTARLVTDAVYALQILSALGTLPEPMQELPEIEQTAERAGARLRESIDGIESLPSDSLTQALYECLVYWTQHVQGEAENPPTGPSFAERTALALLSGTMTEELGWIAAARLLALEWDIDSDNAVSMLDTMLDRLG